MKPNTTDVADTLAHHTTLNMSVLSRQPATAPRIDKCIEYVGKAVNITLRDPVICELGCGCGEIIGPYIDRAVLYGFDCNPANIKYAEEHYRINGIVGDIQSCKYMRGDILVMCDVLEHISQPVYTAAKWMDKFDITVISHPIDEPDGFNRDHVWIFDMADFYGWFHTNNYELLQHEAFTLEMAKPITTVIGLGRRIRTTVG